MSVVKRKPLERTVLHVIVNGTGALVILACALAIVLIFTYSLFPTLLHRLAALLILLGIIAYVPRAVADVYAEIARRGG